MLSNEKIATFSSCINASALLGEVFDSWKSIVIKSSIQSIKTINTANRFWCLKTTNPGHRQTDIQLFCFCLKDKSLLKGELISIEGAVLETAIIYYCYSILTVTQQTRSESPSLSVINRETDEFLKNAPFKINTFAKVIKRGSQYFDYFRRPVLMFNIQQIW